MQKYFCKGLHSKLVWGNLCDQKVKTNVLQTYVNSYLNSELNGKVYDFSVDYDTIDISDIVGIRKYFMKKQYCINAWIY